MYTSTIAIIPMKMIDGIHIHIIHNSNNYNNNLVRNYQDIRPKAFSSFYLSCTN